MADTTMTGRTWQVPCSRGALAGAAPDASAAVEQIGLSSGLGVVVVLLPATPAGRFSLQGVRDLSAVHAARERRAETRAGETRAGERRGPDIDER